MHDAMRERAAVSGANSAADRVLAQATAASGDLEGQRRRLLTVGERFANVARNIPGINGLMTRIRGKRERDRLVLAAAIALCITLLALYYFYF